MQTEQRSDNRNNRASSAGSQSAARALAVLDLLADSSEPMGVREIARRLGLGASIVQRLVTTLSDFGYVERAPDGQKYRIGYRAFLVGHSFVARSDLYAATSPELRLMADRDQINAYFGVLREGAVVYLDALQSKGPIAIVSEPGTRACLHSTAFGKALLADFDADAVASLLGLEPYRALTPKTKVTLASLMDDVRCLRELGYVISDEENMANVFSVGAPLRDRTGQVVAAISGAVPRNLLTDESLRFLIERVKTAAERISRRLGASPSMLAPGAGAEQPQKIGKTLEKC